MKFAGIEVCYIPPKKSAYKLAQEKMAQLTIKEVNSIVAGATFIMLAQLDMVMAKVNVADFAEKIDAKGNEILNLIQAVGYWAAIIFAGIEIVKAFKKQDMAGLIAIACKYACGVGILYGLPDIFDIFKDLFE